MIGTFSRLCRDVPADASLKKSVVFNSEYWLMISFFKVTLQIVSLFMVRMIHTTNISISKNHAISVSRGVMTSLTWQRGYLLLSNVVFLNELFDLLAARALSLTVTKHTVCEPVTKNLPLVGKRGVQNWALARVLAQNTWIPVKMSRFTLEININYILNVHGG